MGIVRRAGDALISWNLIFPGGLDELLAQSKRISGLKSGTAVKKKYQRKKILLQVLNVLLWKSRLKLYKLQDLQRRKKSHLALAESRMAPGNLEKLKKKSSMKDNYLKTRGFILYSLSIFHYPLPNISSCLH